MATLIVTNNNDSGIGSLRDAIANAQSGDTIRFNGSLSNKTITLTSGELDIDKDLIIDGNNAPGLSISGDESFRVFDVTFTPDYQPVDFTLKNLTVADGKTFGTGEDGAGGGIRTASHTNLTVENVTWENNFANGDGGGAIFAGWRSTNTVIDSIFENNSTNGSSGSSERGGGAIAVKSEASLLVQDSEFYNNVGTNGGAINTLLGELIIENSQFQYNSTSRANGSFTYEGYGGAIYTDGASATTDNSTQGIIRISDSVFDTNAGGGQGGGLFLFAYPGDQVFIEDSIIINNQVVKDSSGSALGGGLRHGNSELTINNTAFVNNTAESQGGGLWIGEQSPTTIINSTFSGNRAESLDGNSGLGGAILLANGSNTTNINHTTIANNYAGWQGAGFWGGGWQTTISNSILAYNVAHNGGNPWNIFHHTGTTFSDGGNNIQSEELNPSDTKITASAILTDPLLDSLQESGGTSIHPLLSGSPAINAGSGGESEDQRGVTRIDPDIGSFEQFTVGFSANNSSSQELSSGSFTYDIQVEVSQAVGFDLSIPYTVTGSATEGNDFSSLSGTVVIPAGQISATIPLEILADNESESAETVELTLSSSDNTYVLTDTVHTHTIEDNISAANVIGETGTIDSVTTRWQTLTLQNSYTNPVVLALPLSNKGGEPATVRMRNISSDSFDILLQEPSIGVSPGHIPETVHYVVLEAGTWQLPNGKLLEVGNVSAAGNINFNRNNWSDVTFAHDFTETPVILSQMQTTNGWDYSNTRTKQSTLDGFKVGIEEQESLGHTGHTTETIGYVAIEEGNGDWGGMTYEAIKIDGISNAFSNVSNEGFVSDFAEIPHFIASLASYNGQDPANLRYRNLDVDNVQIKVAEDQSADDELGHIPEQVNYLAFAGDGNLTGDLLN